jgi:hypothetical protein
MPMHRSYLYPIMIVVFIVVILLIQSVPIFDTFDKRLVGLVASLILFGTIILAISE